MFNENFYVLFLILIKCYMNILCFNSDLNYLDSKCPSVELDNASKDNFKSNSFMIEISTFLKRIKHATKSEKCHVLFERSLILLAKNQVFN